MSTGSHYHFLVAAIALLLSGCTGGGANKFSDPTLVRIADLQDRRLGDSLNAYLDHENAVYRREAARAFASLQASPDIDKIGKRLLMDSDWQVREAAALALGQIDQPHSERLLLAALVKEKEPRVLYEILNAYGKVTSGWQLNPNAFIEDSITRAGLAWSIYRAGLRGKVTEDLHSLALTLLQSPTVEPRIAAAHFFARATRGSKVALPVLIESATSDPVAEVRMASSLALGKVPSDTSLQALRHVLREETDGRVIVNAVRALRGFEFNKIKSDLYELVKSRDISAASIAGEIIYEKAPESEWIAIASLINWLKSWQVQSHLYATTLKLAQREDIADEIRQFYARATNPYEKAAWLMALRDYPPALDFLQAIIRESNEPVLRLTAAQAISHLAGLQSLPTLTRPQIAEVVTKVVSETNDLAVAGTLAQALANPAFRGLVSDLSPLQRTRADAELPQHIETLQAIEAALANLEGREVEPISIPYNHPIDWDEVKRIPSDQLATIHTSRGSVVVRLFVEESPGTVINFIELARQGYFNDKIFHRVVPNFVVQTGCSRGDGWGSGDYSLRSELAGRRFGTHILGMASAGKDTESTQWFITHSPTPHLDGRYTAFAEVVSGQKVLELIEVGDRITGVVIQENER